MFFMPYTKPKNVLCFGTEVVSVKHNVAAHALESTLLLLLWVKRNQAKSYANFECKGRAFLKPCTDFEHKVRSSFDI